VGKPNPFYQIYEGAAFLAGVKPIFLCRCDQSNGSAAARDVAASIWERCQVCLSDPRQPAGAVLPLIRCTVIAWAAVMDFRYRFDECYSEIL